MTEHGMLDSLCQDLRLGIFRKVQPSRGAFPVSLCRVDE